MKEFELGHAGDIGISKSKIFEMKKPKLEYLHNEPMIYKYAGQLELYCYVLEKEIERLEKALDKACEELEDLDRCHSYEINKQIVEKKGYSTITFGYQNKDEWKEWCMEND